MAEKVCRLCGKQKPHLIGIFAQDVPDMMTEIIETVCGVQITRADTVTQMVCTTCCQVTIKMYQFRTKSIKNDKDLKARCAGYNIAQLTNSISNVEKKPELKITPPATNTAPAPVVVSPPPRATIPSPASAVVPSPVASTVSTPATATKNLPVAIKRKSTPTPIPQRYRLAHPSIQEVAKKNPTIVLPESCLKSHVGAYITLLTDEVDEYYREKNFSDAEIAKIKKEAYEMAVSKKPPKKKRRLSHEKRVNNMPTTSGDSKKARLSTDSSEKPKVTVTRSKTPAPMLKSPKIEIVSDISVMPRRDNNVRSGRESAVKRPKTPANLGNDSLLKNALSDTRHKDANVWKQDAITLASILKDYIKMNPTNEVEDVDVDGPPSPALLPSDSEDEVIKPKRIGTNARNKALADTDNNPTLTDEECAFFSSRPFVNDKSKSDRPSTAVHNENAQDGANTGNYNENSSDSDPIFFDLDSRGSASTSNSTNGSDVDKTTFTEALRLAPRGTENHSNQPDLSLVSFASKSHKLYICTVCDSHFSSLKEKRVHEKRTHTKCPFCNKRFRTLANRDEHVATTCSINRNPIELKNPKLELKRVDEDEEIRKKYASAFECVVEEEPEHVVEQAQSSAEAEIVQEQSRTEEQPPPVIVAKVPARDNIKPAKKAKELIKKTSTEEDPIVIDVDQYVGENQAPGFCDGTTALAITELEKYLNYAEIIPGNDKSDEVIYISDEEPESSSSSSATKAKQSPRPSSQAAAKSNKKSQEMTINVVNSEILNNVNLHDNDLNVIKSIVSHNNIRLEVKKQLNQWNLNNSLIIDGSTPRVKIFKNLRKYLHQYKIPIEIKHDAALSVQYQPRTPPAPQKLAGLWSALVPEQLKPVAEPHTQSALGTYGVVSIDTVNSSQNKQATSEHPIPKTTSQASQAALEAFSIDIDTVNSFGTKPIRPQKPTPKTTTPAQKSTPKTTPAPPLTPLTTMTTIPPLVPMSAPSATPTAPKAAPARYVSPWAPKTKALEKNVTVLGAKIISGMKPPLPAKPITAPKKNPVVTAKTTSVPASTSLIITSVASTITSNAPIVLNGTASSSVLINGGQLHTYPKPAPYTTNILILQNPLPAPVPTSYSLVTTSVGGPIVTAVQQTSSPNKPPVIKWSGANIASKGTAVSSPGISILREVKKPATDTSKQRVLNGVKFVPSAAAEETIDLVSDAAESVVDEPSKSATESSVEQSPEGATDSPVAQPPSGAAAQASASAGSAMPESTLTNVARLESITQSLMPPVTSDDGVVTLGDMVNTVVDSMVDAPKNPPAIIRVRDLKELS